MAKGTTRKKTTKKPTPKKASKPEKVAPIPKGFHTLTPYLAIRGAANAIEWYGRAFGAKEVSRQYGPGGLILHARLQVGDSILMLSDIFPGSVHKSPLDLGSSSVTIHIYTENVDALWKRALDAGAQVDMPLADMFWGERYGQLRDPFGHSWSLSTQKEILTPEEHAKRLEAAMADFEKQGAGEPAP